MCTALTHRRWSRARAGKWSKEGRVDEEKELEEYHYWGGNMYQNHLEVLIKTSVSGCHPTPKESEQSGVKPQNLIFNKFLGISESRIGLDTVIGFLIML